MVAIVSGSNSDTINNNPVLDFQRLLSPFAIDLLQYTFIVFIEL